MAHPFIAAMERAISLIEENFARKHGLPSPALANEIKKTLAAPVLSMRDALASEPAVLPAHKRRGTWRLESSGEIVEFPKDKYGKTRFLRSNYTARDAAYLEAAREATAKRFTAEDAIATLRKLRPDIGRAKRKPIEADPDPCCPGWRDRPERHLTPEQMIREQFTGRALERELRRVK